MRALAVLCFALSLVGVAPAQKMKIKVGNEAVVFDAMPRQINGVTMVPLRSMVEVMGGTMRWNLERRTASVWTTGRRFDVTLNSITASANDKSVQLDEVPTIIENRLFVPLKFVADATGYVISMEDGWYVLRSTSPKR